MRYALKAPNGRFVYGSEADTMIEAMRYAAGSNDHVDTIVYENGVWDDEAIRKRVKRAGYEAVAIGYRSK